MLPVLGPLPGSRDKSPVPHNAVLQLFNDWLTDNGYTRFIDFEDYVETFTRFMFIECECDRLPWSYSLPSRDSTMLNYFNQFMSAQAPTPSPAPQAPCKPKPKATRKPKAKPAAKK